MNSEGANVDPSKIEAVKNRKAPMTLSEIRSFLGLGDIIGEREVCWRREREKAFQSLKNSCVVHLF